MDLPSDQRQLLQAIFDDFHAAGEWPLIGDLRFELGETGNPLDVPVVARRLLPGYADVQPGDGRATLTLHGVAACTGSEGELGDLLSVTQLGLARYREGHGHGEITDTDLIDELGFDDLRVRKVQHLVGGLPWWGGAGTYSNGRWKVLVGPGMERFRTVTSIEELLEAIPEPHSRAALAAREPATAAATDPYSPLGTSSMTDPRSGYHYDVALSFAGEQRPYVEAVASTLKSQGITVFYDLYERATLWGKDLYQHLSDVYQNQARFVVVFASAQYASKVWTKHELRSAQARALTEKGEYILPARFDDTIIPGIPSTIGYIDLSSVQPKELATLIQAKLGPGEAKANAKETSIGAGPNSPGGTSTENSVLPKKAQPFPPSVLVGLGLFLMTLVVIYLLQGGGGGQVVYPLTGGSSLTATGPWGSNGLLGLGTAVSQLLAFLAASAWAVFLGYLGNFVYQIIHQRALTPQVARRFGIGLMVLLWFGVGGGITMVADLTAGFAVSMLCLGLATGAMAILALIIRTPGVSPIVALFFPVALGLSTGALAIVVWIAAFVPPAAIATP